MPFSRCKYDIGNGRVAEVCEWKGEMRVDLREWQDGKPMKKGIRLTLMRWKNWVDSVECLDGALADKREYETHLGGNVYCSVSEGSQCVDIRQYWKPKEKVVPTKRG